MCFSTKSNDLRMAGVFFYFFLSFCSALWLLFSQLGYSYGSEILNASIINKYRIPAKKVWSSAGSGSVLASIRAQKYSIRA